MDNSYQNSTISQILEAIIDELSFNESNSNIADILLSILNKTEYNEDTKSVIAELLVKVKAKIEGESYDTFDGISTSRIADILISILEESEYTEEPQSRIAELLLELKEKIEEDYTELTVSGAIASFITNVSKPLVSLIADITEQISGASEIKVYHSKQNIFDEQIFEQYDGALQPDGSYYFTNLSSLLNKELYKNNGYTGQMTITLLRKTEINSRTFRTKVVYTDGTTAIIGQVDATGDLDAYIYTTTSGKVVDKILGDYGSNRATYVNLQIEIGTTPSTYEPYNCEIKTVTISEQAEIGDRIDITSQADISAYEDINNIWIDKANTEVSYLYKGEPPLSKGLKLQNGAKSLKPYANIYIIKDEDFKNE